MPNIRDYYYLIDQHHRRMMDDTGREIIAPRAVCEGYIEDFVAQGATGKFGLVNAIFHEATIWIEATKVGEGNE